ncbi:MAG: hypothetical protein WA151_01035 [Desulfatirhabdiaceae bacterium]
MTDTRVGVVICTCGTLINQALMDEILHHNFCQGRGSCAAACPTG